MELALLRHLSDSALRDKARERGLAVEGLERDALIEALRAELALRPDAPPPSAPIAEDAMLEEPIRTRTMAELLLAQGQLERALRILRELGAGSSRDPSLVALLERVEDDAAGRASSRESKAILRANEGLVLRVIGERPRCAVVWRADDGACARSAALVGEGACALRIVRVRACPDHSVETSTEEHEVAREGFERVTLEHGTHAVVALGTRGPRGFASMIHLVSR